MMRTVLSYIEELLISNDLVTSFLVVGICTLFASQISKRLFKGRVHASAIAIALALLASGLAGAVTGGSKGVADLPVLSGIGILGSSMFRDFAIVSTVYGASFSEFKKCGLTGGISLFAGVITSYFVGVAVALAMGYRDVTSLATLGAGTVTFIVGPVTGAALGADSVVIALGIAAGLIKSIVVMVITPFVAKRIGLTTPKTAMIYGGLVGSVSGISAGLTAVDPELVPYGAMTATFYTGLGCLLCPSILYGAACLIFG